MSYKAFVFVAFLNGVGREKLLNGEADATEHRAGIILACTNALFFGHAVIICGNEKLSVADKTNDRELAERHIPRPVTSTE